MDTTAFRPEAGAEPIPGYRLEVQIGKGGVGEVWRAIAPGDFPVALKFLVADEAESERELRSLQMLQKVRDGHLLALSGVWKIPGYFVLAMELADGTLLDRLKHFQKQGLPGVPREELLRSFEQAATGLDFLNEPRHLLDSDNQPVGIQHGDVKPANLLLTGTLCKVGDFGLLRRLTTAMSHKSSSMTPAYAAPEVFDGQPGRASDQYSLAVTWCHLRGGRLPFVGGPAEMMSGHLRKKPDLSMLPETERLAVARALSKEPANRWPSCKALVEALQLAAAAVPPASATGFEQPLVTTQNASTPTDAHPDPVPGSARRFGGRPLTWLLLIVFLGSAVVLAMNWVFRPPSTGSDAGLHQGSTDRGDDKDQGKVKDEPKTGAGPKEGQSFTNDLGMKFVWIKPGTFLMGSPDGKTPPGAPEEADRSPEETPHLVKLTKGYYMSTTLVTQWQWEQVMGKEANRSSFLGTGEDEKKQLPVDSVSWDDCQAFCKKMSARDGRKYRLPTEAEWEYACRAGRQTPSAFWWGNAITTDQANYDGTYSYPKTKPKEGETTLPKGEFRERTTPVDQFPANRWGLHDMHGNLWQWCEDYYGPYHPEEDNIDPVRREKIDGDYRSLRGGSWISAVYYCRAASRRRDAPDRRDYNLGCRLIYGTD